jgi:ADP-ribosylglycohydrolase
VLYLSWKYADSFEKAVLANTNVGGENCHRGSALGAVMGAALGESGIPPRFISGLADSEEIRKEIDAFVAAVMGSSGSSAAAAEAAAPAAAV